MNLSPATEFFLTAPRALVPQVLSTYTLHGLAAHLVARVIPEVLT
jgi:hypothetical protein